MVVFTDAMFDKYPPPADSGLTDEEVAHIRSLTVGHEILEPPPSPSLLAAYGYDSHEHYAVLSLYGGW